MDACNVPIGQLSKQAVLLLVQLNPVFNWSYTESCDFVLKN